MTGPLVELVREGPVAVLRLNRPHKRNAMDEALLQGLQATIRSLTADAGCRVVIITGAGSSFCAGADLGAVNAIVDDGERRRAFAPWAAHLAELIRVAVHDLLASDIVSIAAVNGPAVGGGWALALACDFRLATEEATFWFPEAGYGRVVGAPTRRMLLHYLGEPRTKDILMTSRRYSAAEVQAMDLLRAVVPVGSVMQAAQDLAQQLARVDRATLATLKRELSAEVTRAWSTE